MAFGDQVWKYQAEDAGSSLTAEDSATLGDAPSDEACESSVVLFTKDARIRDSRQRSSVPHKVSNSFNQGLGKLKRAAPWKKS